MEMLDAHVAPYDEVIYRRCKYVVAENLRLLAACDDLKNGAIEALGQKMFETHDGLSKHYEVSCKELDFLVNYVRHNPAVLGARMMGGGFGGCTINLVKENEMPNLLKKISIDYKNEMNLDLTPYEAKIEDGTNVIDL
jgi:galactokinase